MNPELIQTLFAQGGVPMILIAAASTAAWVLVLRGGFMMHRLLGRTEQPGAVHAAEIERLEHGLSALKTITVILPLLGLLGTVLGMLVTFAVIQQYGTTRPAFFADGIRQALLTTQAGLCTALPLLFSHHLLNSRLRTITSRMRLFEQAANHSQKTESA